MSWVLLWGVLWMGCDSTDYPNRNCATRQLFYADPDGDGLGDPNQVYVGCEPPQGYVTTPAPESSTE